MNDRSKTRPPVIVLNKDEWEAFVEEVGKLLKAYDEVLRGLKKHGLAQPLRSHGPSIVKPSFASRVLDFFGLKPQPVPRRFCPYCGNEAEFRDRFCRICGRSIDIVVEPTQRRTA